MRFTIKITLIVITITVLIACNKEKNTNYTKITVTKNTTPVLEANDGLASDPTIVKVGDTLYMYYLDYNLTADESVFSLAKSVDGQNWIKNPLPILESKPSAWDKLIETPEVVLINNEFYMYYIGYPESNFDNGIYESEIGLAKSTDGIVFTRYGNAPIVSRGGKKDKDGITSPSITEKEGKYYMIYTGWKNITKVTGFLGQTGAISSDGITWEKENKGIFKEVQETDAETATESDLIKGTDGKFYLVFTGENGIGLAKSDNPFGPWNIYPEPIIKKEFNWESGEIVAPDVIIENGKMKIWYVGVIGEFNGASIGYAEINFPIEW